VVRDTALLDLLTPPIPDVCQVDECEQSVETWCPLCDTFLCRKHDELVAYRGHPCLSDEMLP